jgi:hypothetical protein
LCPVRLRLPEASSFAKKQYASKAAAGLKKEVSSFLHVDTRTRYYGLLKKLPGSDLDKKMRF